MLPPTRTYQDVITEVQAWLDEIGETGVTLTIIQQAINSTHLRRLTDPTERWPFMLVKPRTFTTVVGQQIYQLHEQFFMLMYAKNLTTGEFLTEFTDANVLDSGADWNTQTDPATQFALWGHSEVANQPTSPSTVAVSSSNPGDDGQVTVGIKGFDANGDYQSESITCGATGLIEFAEIQKVTKSYNWVGTMTLTSDSGTVTNVSLERNGYGKSYQQLYLLTPPSQADVIEYRYYRLPNLLLEQTARPDLPAPFEELLVWETLMDMSAYNQYDKSTVGYWQIRRDEVLNSLRQRYGQAHTINQQPTYTNYIPR